MLRLSKINGGPGWNCTNTSEETVLQTAELTNAQPTRYILAGGEGLEPPMWYNGFGDRRNRRYPNLLHIIFNAQIFKELILQIT